MNHLPMFSRAGKASNPSKLLLKAAGEVPQRISFHQVATGKRPPPAIENSEDYEEVLKCFKKPIEQEEIVFNELEFGTCKRRRSQGKGTSSFKAVSRSKVEHLHRNRTGVPEVGKYRPKFKVVDGDDVEVDFIKDTRKRRLPFEPKRIRASTQEGRSLDKRLMRTFNPSKGVKMRAGSKFRMVKMLTRCEKSADATPNASPNRSKLAKRIIRKKKQNTRREKAMMSRTLTSEKFAYRHKQLSRDYHYIRVKTEESDWKIEVNTPAKRPSLHTQSFDLNKSPKKTLMEKSPKEQLRRPLKNLHRLKQRSVDRHVPTFSLSKMTKRAP